MADNKSVWIFNPQILHNFSSVNFVAINKVIIDLARFLSYICIYFISLKRQAYVFSSIYKNKVTVASRIF